MPDQVAWEGASGRKRPGMDAPEAWHGSGSKARDGRGLIWK